MVVASESAYLGRSAAVNGVNVYSGDAFSTDPSGTLRLKVGSSQVYLLSASNATLSRKESKIQATLTAGTLGFSSTPVDAIEVQTILAAVRPADGQSAFGQVTVVAPDHIIVAAYHGSLVVSGYGDERTVKEGETYNVSLAPDPPEPASSQPPVPGFHSGHGHLLFTVMFVAASAIVSWRLYHHFAYESDPNPPSN